jgi:hypothetical protein
MLADLLRQVQALESRLQRLRVGLDNLIQLEQLDQDQSGARGDRQSSGREFQSLEQAVDHLEAELVSHLVSWQHLQQPFWQAVRYGGLGLLLGWGLAWLAHRP